MSDGRIRYNDYQGNQSPPDGYYQQNNQPNYYNGQYNDNGNLHYN